MLCGVLTPGCGSPELETPHFHAGDDYSEQVYNQTRILETWQKEGVFYTSPELQSNNPKNRIVIRFTIEKETPADEPVSVWGQGTSADNLATRWEKISWTWIEAQSRVGVLDFSSDVHGAQLRIHENDMAYVDFIGFALAFISETPASDMVDGISGAQPTVRYQSLEATFENAGVKTRSDWEASAMGGCDVDTTDRYRIALHHTAGPQQHNASYAAQVRQTQQGHFANGWCDVGYHFLVTADGSTWEGRPLDYRGSHVGGNNSGNIGVAFVGCFNEGDVEPGWSCDQFPQADKHPSASLIENGGALLKLIVDHFGMTVNEDTVKGHDDHPNVAKSCPGSYLSERLDELRTGALHGAPNGSILELSPINDFEVTQPSPSPFDLYEAPSGGLYFNENDVCHTPIDDALIHCTPEGSQQANGHRIKVTINDEYGDGNTGEGSIVNTDTGEAWYTINSNTVTGYGFEDTVCLPPGDYNFTFESDVFSADMNYKITNETMDGHVDADTENGDIPEGEDNPYVEVLFNIPITTPVIGFELALRDGLFSGPRMDNVNGNQAQIHQFVVPTLIIMLKKT